MINNLDKAAKEPAGTPPLPALWSLSSLGSGGGGGGGSSAEDAAAGSAKKNSALILTLLFRFWGSLAVQTHCGGRDGGERVLL